MKSKLHAGGICSLLVCVAITQAALGQVRYDAAGDFSPTNNPNGAWSYGWVSATNLDFMMYTITDTPYSLKEWTGPFPRDPNLFTVPCVLLNDSDTPVAAANNTFQAHRLTAHPGPNNERSVVRWTSPASGPVDITSAFEGRSVYPTTTDASVYHNGNQVFIGGVNGYGAASRVSFATNLIVAAGDTLDFIVDYGSNSSYDGDTTQVDATIICGANPMPTCVTPPSGLVSWWQAEGNANDTVDSNSGILLNGATFAPGRVGQAFSFDGTNDYIRVTDRPNLHFTNALTIEAWLFPTSLGGYHHEVVSKWDWHYPGAQKGYTTTVMPDGRIGFGVCNDGYCSEGPVVGSSASAYRTNSLPVNQWTHFAATYDGSALTIYVNGILEGQTAYNGGIFPGTNDLLIGAALADAGGGALSPFAGLIDEPATYNRAVSSAEIQAIYNAGSAGKCKEPSYACATLYTNDFENPVGPEWSTNHRIQTPGGTRPQTWFLGGDINGHNLGFANDSVTLSLNNLAPHSWLEITFDLYIINTWDGISASGPDYFTLAVQDGPVLLQTTFANTVVSQSYPADVGSGSYPSRTGALEVNSLGFDWLNLFGDTVYRIIRRVHSSASSVQFQFIGGVNEPDGRNETWGLDNVTVCAGDPPPTIVSQPQSQTIFSGDTATFSVSATGSPPLSYQWQFAGTDIPNATNSSFIIPSAGT